MAALRDFITGWYVSHLSADSAHGQPEAGPQERLTKTGDNLANVTQYLTAFSESIVEDAALARLDPLGYSVPHGQCAGLLPVCRIESCAGGYGGTVQQGHVTMQPSVWMLPLTVVFFWQASSSATPLRSPQGSMPAPWMPFAYGQGDIPEGKASVATPLMFGWLVAMFPWMGGAMVAAAGSLDDGSRR